MPPYKKITLPEIQGRGRLMFAEESRHVPFAIKRVFAIYDVPPGTQRGGHAHRAQEQFIVMLSGACTFTIEDGTSQAEERLTRPTEGLYVPPMIWLALGDFAPGSVCLVRTSGLYDEGDYIRERSEFDRLTGQR